MQGVRKQYDAALAEWSSRAERELKNWLQASGYDVTHLPHGTMGTDLYASNGKESFYIEIERTGSNRWEKDKAPPAALKTSELNVLERRGEYDPDVFLFVMRMDLKAALVVFPRSLTPDRLVESPNKLVKSGEYVFKVLLIEVLPMKERGTSKSL